MLIKLPTFSYLSRGLVTLVANMHHLLPELFGKDLTTLAIGEKMQGKKPLINIFTFNTQVWEVNDVWSKAHHEVCTT